MCTHVDLYVHVYCVCICAAYEIPLIIQSWRCRVHFCSPELCIVLEESHTHALCYIKASLQKWLLYFSFSTREIKNRNIHALWMYFPSRKCAVVGVWHWLHTITCHLLPRLPLAGTCGALWRKAFLTGPRSPEELLETGRRTMSVEPGEQWGGFERWHHHGCKCGGAGTWPSDYSKGQESTEMNTWLKKCRGTGEDDDLQQWHSESTCHDHISSADAWICCHPVIKNFISYLHLGSAQAVI